MQELPLYKVFTFFVLGHVHAEEAINFEFKELDKALSEGYKVESVHQISAGGGNTSLAGAYITFVLNKTKDITF